MKNYLTLGPVRLRISTKHLAPWGYERFGVGGFSMLSRTNGGELVLASYRPKNETWRWSVTITKRRHTEGWRYKAKHRTGQWHDYYRLPFGRTMIVSRQDYHLEPTIQQIEDASK